MEQCSRFIEAIGYLGHSHFIHSLSLIGTLLNIIPFPPFPRHSLSSLEQRLTTLEQRLLEELSLVQRGDDDLVPSTVGALSQGLEGEDEGVRGDGGKRNPLMGRVELRGGRGEGWSSMLDLSEDLDSLSDSEGR